MFLQVKTSIDTLNSSKPSQKPTLGLYVPITKNKRGLAPIEPTILAPNVTVAGPTKSTVELFVKQSVDKKDQCTKEAFTNRLESIDCKITKKPTSKTMVLEPSEPVIFPLKLASSSECGSKSKEEINLVQESFTKRTKKTQKMGSLDSPSATSMSNATQGQRKKAIRSPSEPTILPLNISRSAYSKSTDTLALDGKSYSQYSNGSLVSSSSNDTSGINRVPGIKIDITEPIEPTILPLKLSTSRYNSSQDNLASQQNLSHKELHDGDEEFSSKPSLEEPAKTHSVNKKTVLTPSEPIIMPLNIASSNSNQTEQEVPSDEDCFVTPKTSFVSALLKEPQKTKSKNKEFERNGAKQEVQNHKDLYLRPKSLSLDSLLLKEPYKTHSKSKMLSLSQSEPLMKPLRFTFYECNQTQEEVTSDEEGFITPKESFNSIVTKDPFKAPSRDNSMVLTSSKSVIEPSNIERNQPHPDAQYHDCQPTPKSISLDSIFLKESYKTPSSSKKLILSQSEPVLKPLNFIFYECKQPNSEIESNTERCMATKASSHSTLSEEPPKTHCKTKQMVLTTESQNDCGKRVSKGDFSLDKLTVKPDDTNVHISRSNLDFNEKSNTEKNPDDSLSMSVIGIPSHDNLPGQSSYTNNMALICAKKEFWLTRIIKIMFQLFINLIFCPLQILYDVTAIGVGIWKAFNSKTKRWWFSKTKVIEKQNELLAICDVGDDTSYNNQQSDSTFKEDHPSLDTNNQISTEGCNLNNATSNVSVLTKSTQKLDSTACAAEIVDINTTNKTFNDAASKSVTAIEGSAWNAFNSKKKITRKHSELLAICDVEDDTLNNNEQQSDIAFQEDQMGTTAQTASDNDKQKKRSIAQIMSNW